MATAAVRVEASRVKQKPRKRVKPRLIVVQGGRELDKAAGEALCLDASGRFRARQLQRRLERTQERHRDAPERQSVAIAMLAVEERLVKAFWTIARQPAKGALPGGNGRCGIDYVPERGDLNAYADPAGGKWQTIAPRPPVPSGKEIDDANAALDWLLYIDEPRRKLLVVGATSKRGDSARKVAWARIRQAMPELHGLSVTTLKRRYAEALRIIVTELTIARVG